MSRDKNKELMLAAGSKDGAYDIEAPDQWRWVLRHAKDAHEKAMNWVKSKTTAFRHESPYCVDEHGNELYLDHAAVELGWELQTARNVFCQLEAQGRIRLQKGKRIWYCADVPQAYAPAQEQTDQGPADDADDPTETNENWRTKGEGNNRVHSYWASYVVDFIESLPSAQKVAAKRKLRAYPKWRQEFLADGLAALRSIADRYEDSTLREIGIPKKRLPKRRPAECKWVQLSLLEEPNFVHGYSETTESDSVQSAPDSVQTENPGLHTVENGAPSLLSSSATTSLTTTTGASVAELDAVVVSQKFGQHGTITHLAVLKFLGDCRQQSPECTTADVLSAMDGIRITKRTENPIGLLLSQVPPILVRAVDARRKNEKKEKTVQQERDRATARSILKSPEAYTPEDRIWARALQEDR